MKGVAVKREGRDGVPTIHAMVDGCICCTTVPYEEYAECEAFSSVKLARDKYPNAVLCDCNGCRQMLERRSKAMIVTAEEIGAVEIAGAIHGTIDGAVCCNPDVSEFSSITVRTVDDVYAILHRNRWCMDDECREVLERIDLAYDGDRCLACNAPLSGNRCLQCGTYNTVT